MRSHTERVRGVCLDSRGQQLVTCSSDNTIRVWDTASGEQVSVSSVESQAREREREGEWGGGEREGERELRHRCSFDPLLLSSLQLFDFRSVSEAPLCVSHHPEQQVFACGFSSGAVRVFHTPTTAVLAEHR